MKIEIDAISYKGMVRDNNEDALSISGYILRDDATEMSIDTPEDGSFYLLVADGMGGHDNGEEASMYALEEVRNKINQNEIGAETFEDDIRETVHNVSLRLNQIAAERGQQHPMGCTLTGVVWHYGRIWLINAGDSRTYRFRNGILRQLTTDETDFGYTGDPNASKLLLNCVGGGLEGRLTIEDIAGKLLEADTLLICSDGLTDMVPEEQIETALAEGAKAADLYRMACEAGGADNTSIILATIS